MNALELTGVGKSYGDFRLEDMTFTLPSGYIMGLIGPNGAGKTTMIKLIMNLIRRDTGEIKLFGEDNLRGEIAVKSRIGFVYETPSYYEHLSLKSIKGIIAPFYSTWDEDRFQHLVRVFELPAAKPMKKLSHGMVMKASIAIALSHHADLVIMDEPTSGLDPVFRRELLDMLAETMQDERKSVLFSTHITSDLERIADYITFVNRGRLVFSSTKDEILERYGIVKGGKELLDDRTRELFLGIRLNDFGFEALTSQTDSVRKLMKDQVVVERASLEDIMYYVQRGRSHVAA